MAYGLKACSCHPFSKLLTVNVIVFQKQECISGYNEYRVNDEIMLQICDVIWENPSDVAKFKIKFMVSF